MRSPILAVAFTGLLLGCRSTPDDLRTAYARTTSAEPVAITMGVGGVT